MPDDAPKHPIVARMLAEAKTVKDLSSVRWVRSIDWTCVPSDPEEERRSQIVGFIQSLKCQAEEHSPLWGTLSSAEDHAWDYLRAYQNISNKESDDGQESKSDHT